MSKHKSVSHRTEGQKDYIRSIVDHDIVFCHGPAGSGKAMPIDTPVLTPSGWMNIGELEVGDEVCTPSGITTVEGVFSQGVKQVFRLTLSDRTSTRCCDDHLWTTVNLGHERKLETHPIKDFRNKLTTNGGRSRYGLPPIQPVEMPTQELPLDPYALGLLLGDGSFRGRASVRFTTPDNELLDSLIGLLPAGHESRPCSDKISYRICKSSSTTSIYSLIRDLELHGKLSYEKTVPSQYLFADVRQRLALLQGLLDTDGSTFGHTTEFSSSSEALCDAVVFLTQSLGGKATKSVRNTTHLDSYKATLSFPEWVTPFRLKRKVDAFKPRTKYPPNRIIRTVEPDGYAECVCIKIKSEDGLFLVNDCIPTHNTHIAAGMAAGMLQRNAVSKIVICRPVIGVGQDIGFLPGTSDDKVAPYLRPLFDELSYFISYDHMRRYRDIGQVEIVPLCMMRGRTFNDAFVILDEAQNATMEELRMFLTRLGRKSKMVLTADISQSDLSQVGRGAFSKVTTLLTPLEEVGIVRLTEPDIVRHKLIHKIIRLLP